MDWQPISREELADLIAADLLECSADLVSLFREYAIPPEKWAQTPWGDPGEGFWAVAVCGQRALWFNDIEDGFNVSRFSQRGRIPDDEYWCNKDPLKWALPRLVGSAGTTLGPPQPAL